MKIQACRVIFLIFLGLLSQVASAQPADRNTCNGEVARFLKATNQKYGSNADITFRRTCESSGVSAAYAAVGHSELAPSPAARTSGGAGSQSPARSAPSYSNGPAGGRPEQGNAATGKQPFRYSDAVDQCVRIGLHPQFKATEQISNQCSYAIQITFCSEGVVARGDSQGRKVSDCSRRLTGAKTLRAGQSDTFNVGAIGVRTHYIACRDPFYAPANALTWNGVGFSGRCQANN